MLDETEHHAKTATADPLSLAPELQLENAGTRLLETVIANSSIQFFDLTIDESLAVGISERYFEGRDEHADRDGPSLHQVTLDENGVFHHPLTHAVTDPSQTYAVDGRKALDAYVGCWVPLPFMRSGNAFANSPILEEGPSNWTRVFIHKDVRNAAHPTYRIVLTVDTSLEQPAEGQTASPNGPSLSDALDGTVFRCSAHVDDIGWFVTEPWVDEWLMETYRETRLRTQPAMPGEAPAPATPLEHLAHYLTLLAVLTEAGRIPNICFMPPASGQGRDSGTVPVDLVLDIGASRTYALLSETSGGRSGSRPIDALPLRDLANPWLVHQGIFASQIEFARAHFGKEVYSRWSGRTSAFHWPSIARVGAEAARLAAEQNAADAFTGLSSPMRYLWDDRASRHVWRFAGPSGTGQRRNPLISGPLLAHLTESGDLLDSGAKRPPTTKPRFSRSSLLTFFAAELIQHALSGINAAGYRRTHDRPADPRRLARIIVTVPASLQSEERAIVAGRLKAAAQLVWQSMGWSGASATVVPPLPEVVVSGDVASHTQLAFLDNEIGHKFRGNARSYFELLGRARPGQGSGRSLRIATLDVGGGSTSLSLATYGLGDNQTLLSTPHLVEGFAVGSDEVLKALIETFILPSIEQRLSESKLGDARQFLRDIVNGATHGRASRLGEFRRRLASEIAMPAAIAILKEHEILRATSSDQAAVRSLGDLLSASHIDARPAADELESLASDEGGDGFHCLGTPIAFTLTEVAAIIRRVLAPVMTNAVRTIRALDCDVVLLSGWLSRLPVLKEALLEGMPIRPDRIIAMHEYRMGEGFPGRSALGNVDDPKTLPAVGALLACSAPMRIGGLAITRRELPDAAAILIGPIGPDGLIAGDAIIFDSARSDGGGRAAAPSQQSTVAVQPPMILGIRRSPLPNWPALPMYALALEDILTEEAPRMPARVTLEWKPDRDGSALHPHNPPGVQNIIRPWIVRATDADGIELAASEISLRLQTLPSSAGHWLDTGVFEIA